MSAEQVARIKRLREFKPGPDANYVQCPLCFKYNFEAHQDECPVGDAVVVADTLAALRAAPAPDEELWRHAALRVGEELATCGPPGYYEFTPEQWRAWALSVVAKPIPEAAPEPTPAGRETLERLCVNCGKTARVRRGDVLPECVGPDGMAACTFDLTDAEAAQFWRQKWHEQQRTVSGAQREVLEQVRAEMQKWRDANAREGVWTGGQMLGHVLEWLDARLAALHDGGDHA